MYGSETLPIRRANGAARLNPRGVSAGCVRGVAGLAHERFPSFRRIHRLLIAFLERPVQLVSPQGLRLPRRQNLWGSPFGPIFSANPTGRSRVGKAMNPGFGGAHGWVSGRSYHGRVGGHDMVRYSFGACGAAPDRPRWPAGAVPASDNVRHRSGREVPYERARKYPLHNQWSTRKESAALGVDVPGARM